ncbi:glycosyltransferase family 1 protein, partial [Streptomyces sp. NPDC004561]
EGNEVERIRVLASYGDLSALPDAVRTLAADPARRTAFGAAARTMVEGRTWAAVGDQLVAHYDDVLAARRTAVAA